MSWWGNFMNSVTGTSTSARQQFGHQMDLQKDAQNFAKWQMANAHQMEVKDLQDAGLNPVLSAGGSGASAGVTEGSAQSGAPMVNPADILFTAINTAKSLEKTDAEIKNIDAETEFIEAQTGNVEANTTRTTTKTKKDKVIEQIYNTPIIGHVLGFMNELFGGGGAATGAIAGAQVSQAATSAKKARTPKKNKIGF